MKRLMVAIIILALVGTSSASDAVGANAQQILEPGHILELNGTVYDTEIMMYTWGMGDRRIIDYDCYKIVTLTGGDWSDHRLFVNGTYSKAEVRMFVELTVNVSKQNLNYTVDQGTMDIVITHNGERVVDELDVAFTPNATRVAMWFDANPDTIPSTPSCLPPEPMANETVVNDTVDPPIVNDTVVQNASNETENLPPTYPTVGCGHTNGTKGVLRLNGTTGTYDCDLTVTPDTPDPTEANASEPSATTNQTSGNTTVESNETSEGNASIIVTPETVDTTADNVTEPSSVSNDTAPIVNDSVVSEVPDPAPATPGFTLALALLGLCIGGRFKAGRV